MPEPWLAGWIIVTLALFASLDARRASLLALMGGWALLPNATYPATTQAGNEVSAAVHALAIPAPPWINKATAIGLGCLLGLAAWAGPALRRARGLRWWDAPMVAWCLVPVASAVANGLPLRGGLDQARDLALGWGVPYLVGRTLFATPTALEQIARAWELAGLAVLPLALVEFVRGPFLYHAAYGFHPYRWSGSDRRVGHRPVLLFESGNQFGVWLASAAVASVWLWALGKREAWRVGPVRVPAGVVPATLVLATIGAQSHAAIVLMLFALTPLAFSGRIGYPGKLLVGLALGVLGVAVVGGLGWIAVKSGGDPRSAARTLFHALGKSSFTWRLARAADYLPVIAQRPILGWGRADWSSRPDGTFEDPIAMSVWFLAAGMFGAAGLACSFGVIAVPLTRGGLWLRRHGGTSPAKEGVAAALAVLAVQAADLPMNSVLILPVLVVAGGLNALGRAEPVVAPVGRTDDRGNMRYSVPGFRTGN